jgi:hypothetical protein
MSTLRLVSDHAYDWSDRYIGQGIIGTTQAPPGIAARPASLGGDLARLADRAVQALRQAWLQMQRGSGAWAEVLPLSELSRRAAADGLRAAGRACCHPHAGRQLPAGAQRSGRDLRDKSRAIAAPRGAVRAGGERSARIARRIDRYRRRGAGPRQHDRTVAGCAALRISEHGDVR